MISKVYTSALNGLDSEVVEVECDAGVGQFSFLIVGLPDTAVQESRERVRAAIKNSGFSFPRGRVTVNLAPADVRKEGSGYDLPLALSVLLAEGVEIQSQFIREELTKSIWIGELSLEGNVRPVPGVLSMIFNAREKGFTSAFVPEKNLHEARLVRGIKIFPVTSLAQCLFHILGKTEIPFYEGGVDSWSEEVEEHIVHDMAYIRGQNFAKRALELAAAGAHNVFLSGPPGSGKTLLARTFPSILPPLSEDEMLEVTRIWSAAGLLSPEKPLMRTRPFRNPHHTASSIALIGGGSWPRPGEISLSHRGVLFMDEFPEFPRSVLESLRQPLEDGVVLVSRIAAQVRFPARFILIAARNPCPCGNYGDSTQRCSCSLSHILKYEKRISGPLMDRIDMYIEVPRVEVHDLEKKEEGELSSDIRKRVCSARAIQTERFKGTPLMTNADMSSKDVEKYCSLSEATRQFFSQAITHHRLSARSYFRILKLARTIADMDASDYVTKDHIAESFHYRPKVLIE